MTKNIMIENKNLYTRYNDEFKEIFGRNLKKYLNPLNPFSLMTGFDIVAFDDDLNTPDGTSTKDFVTSQYGEKGCKLIEKLLE